MSETLVCGTCGIEYSVPTHWLKERKETRTDFFCPNGHCRVFVESTADRLLREKNEMERRLQAQLNDSNHARLVAEKERDAERRKRRTIEARVSKGVCPCCNRTFQDLQRHMATKHKDYALPPGVPKQIEGTVQ